MSINDNNNTTTRFQVFSSMVWVAIILPIKGMLNPLWFLDTSFPDKFDNSKKIISKSIVNKIIPSSGNYKREVN